MSISMESRYLGTLVGSACGDALGATLEFKSRGEVALKYPQGLRDIIGGGWMGWSRARPPMTPR
jgi:ADP-ribosylglycohydrolase